MIGELQLPPASVSIPGIIDNDDGSELTHRTITDADRGDGGGCSDGIRHNNNSNRSNHRELIQLKQQLSKQQNQIDILSKRLNACEIERDVLVEEKKVLLVELTATNSLEHSVSSRDGWGGMRRSSLQMSSYTDMQYNPSYNNQDNETNLRVMRKSFQNYIKDSRRNSYADKQKICVLQREVETLKQRLVSATNSNGGHGNKHMSASDRTAPTYPSALDLSSSLRGDLSISQRLDLSSSLRSTSVRSSYTHAGGGDHGSGSGATGGGGGNAATAILRTANTNTNNNSAMLRSSLTLRDLQPPQPQSQSHNISTPTATATTTATTTKAEQRSSIDSTTMLRRNSITSTSVSGNACSFMNSSMPELFYNSSSNAINHESMPELDFSATASCEELISRTTERRKKEELPLVYPTDSSSNAIHPESMPELDFSVTASCEELISRTTESRKKEELMKHLAHGDNNSDREVDHRQKSHHQQRRATAFSTNYTPARNEFRRTYSDNRPIRREVEHQHDDFMEVGAYQRRRTADLLLHSPGVGVRGATNKSINSTTQGTIESKKSSSHDLVSTRKTGKSINNAADAVIDNKSRASSDGSELLVDFGETTKEGAEQNDDDNTKASSPPPQQACRRRSSTTSRRWHSVKHSVNHVDFSDDSNASSSAKPNAKNGQKPAAAQEVKEEETCSTDRTINRAQRRRSSTARRWHSITEGSNNSTDLRGSWTAGWFRRG